MIFYAAHLSVLGLSLVGATYCLRRSQPAEPRSQGEEVAQEEYGHDLDSEIDDDAFVQFQNQFLSVYIPAVAADWLQGSFTYSLYKTSYNLPESFVAFLFATGFLSGAISATFAGALADRYGRKKAALCYCLLYGVSNLCILFNRPWLLIVGRILGGVSTTLLFSVFEAYMIGEYHRRALHEKQGSVSDMLGFMSMTNGLVAIVSGVLAQGVVRASGSQKAPFICSTLFLVLSGVLMKFTWTENYGHSRVTKNMPLCDGIKASLCSLQDPRILGIAVTTTIFEGSMYILVYFWAPALTSARIDTYDFSKPPFGLIFANFMASLTLGSLSFSLVTWQGNSAHLSSNTLQLVLATAACCLLFTIHTGSELWRFWAFTVFELCVGLYIPIMGFLKSCFVPDSQRGSLYGLIRFPLNAVIVISLATVTEGDEGREVRFMFCGASLLFCVWLVRQCFSTKSTILE